MWFTSSKQTKHLDAVKDRIDDLRAERMTLEYQRATLDASILANQHTLKALEDSLPLMEQLAVPVRPARQVPLGGPPTPPPRPQG